MWDCGGVQKLLSAHVLSYIFRILAESPQQWKKNNDIYRDMTQQFRAYTYGTVYTYVIIHIYGLYLVTYTYSRWVEYILSKYTQLTIW